MLKKESRSKTRKRRHLRVRKKILGTRERPRLSVFRSKKHIYAQIIDDTKGHTLVAVSSLEALLREKLKSGGTREAAEAVGKVLAEKARSLGIQKVVFDRGGYLYHGRVAALAKGARENGLEF